MFYLGYRRARKNLGNVVDIATTPELVMKHRLQIVELRSRLGYYIDRLNEIDEKFDFLENYGRIEVIDLQRRLRYMARNYQYFIGFDIEYCDADGNNTILRYDKHYDNVLFGV